MHSVAAKVLKLRLDSTSNLSVFCPATTSDFEHSYLLAGYSLLPVGLTKRGFPTPELRKPVILLWADPACFEESNFADS